MDDFEFSEAGFWLEPDFVLTNLVATMVNMSEMPIGVTLFIKGMVLSGALVSERQYLASLSDVFKSLARSTLEVPDEAIMQEIENALDFNDLAEGTIYGDDEEDDDFLPFVSQIRYLHLTDIVVISPQPSIAFQQSILPILRIRLSAIDGWLLGQATGVNGDNDTTDSNGKAGFLH